MRARIAILGGALLGLVLFVPIVGSLIEHVIYSGHVLPGVAVDGVSVAGKKDVAADDAIAHVAADLDRTPIRVRAGTRHFAPIDPSLIAFDVDVDATARRARADGRDGNPAAMVWSTVVRRVRNDEVPLVVRYDAGRLEGLLDGWANAVDKGVVEGNIRFVGTNVVATAPHAGFGLQRDAARRRVIAALSSAHRDGEIDLPTGTVVPAVDQAHVDATAAQARALLATDKQIHAQTTTVTLTRTALASTMGTRIVGNTLQLTIDTAKLRLALGPSVAKFEQPPVDATFTISSANVPSVVPSHDGQLLDLDSVARDLLAGQTDVVAHVRNVHPAHDTKWAQKLGIIKQVSTFTTNHPAGQPRVHNIHLAADVLNNTIVEPGQLFSLNDKLGPRTPEKGYVKAPILVEDGFGEDYGGGISQLTTTLYNAVFFGGYVDVDHSPHHFYITRYPMGREATINYPSIDLKFRNDTHHGVLIRTSYSATSITVTFYGDNDGRTVREENRREFNMVPITDEVLPCPVKEPEVNDPNNDCAHLLAFQRVTAVTGETGWDVEFDRVIDQPGQPEKRQHYRVHYPMLPNKVLVGTAVPSTTAGPSTTAAATTSTTGTSTPRHT